jgi:hypothetical protein
MMETKTEKDYCGRCGREVRFYNLKYFSTGIRWKQGKDAHPESFCKSCDRVKKKIRDIQDERLIKQEASK